MVSLILLDGHIQCCLTESNKKLHVAGMLIIK
uniref:Uncharacterized protein n=1 Tax=Arundo donax TaxID=35708 RepID=A0A0A9C9L0_ARUDO